jgi:hypothetical protein
MVEGTATTTVACLTSVGETVVTQRGFYSVATLWSQAQCFAAISGRRMDLRCSMWLSYCYTKWLFSCLSVSGGRARPLVLRFPRLWPGNSR